MMCVVQLLALPLVEHRAPLSATLLVDLDSASFEIAMVGATLPPARADG